MTNFPDVEWAVSDTPVSYAAALAVMEARARAIREDGARELVWFLEHPPLYTAGTSARPEDLRDPARFPVFDAGRGGQYTYHGPGQRVAYLMLDVGARGRDVEGRVGVWVDRTEPGGPLREDKIAAIGVRLKRWVSLHGISLNVEPDLEHFTGITPCGIDDARYGVTSLAGLGRVVSMAEADMALRDAFEDVFRSKLVRVAGPKLDAGG
jgi:lipoyl(octanoyl) transferase